MNNLSPLEVIFFAALEKGTPQERAAYLDEACAGDPECRRRVERMLAAQAQAGSFLEQPAPALGATVDAPIAEGPGTVIGPYKLLEQIGEGGFGVVFMAEQTEPVRRRVALKVVKPGMDTRQVVARFEAERQALALMDHPNIAHVFDGGETTSGRPYFVMELVRGIPMTEFCDQNHLTVRQRLELFTSVCQAVQHAHQKGIIHRDLKPSNVLVTLLDSAPVAKVIDFGIAKATGQQLTEKTLFTNFAAMIGTPIYMSPEQAQMSAVDVDTRSDIYSLGVLLYELLTGTTPFDKERLRTAAYDEIRRIIREEEPARPSTRFSTLGRDSATVSANRQSDPKRLSQLFRGELDWIVMKALEKDRSRRYETANGFVQDVQRYLADEPVHACPPSAGYRLRKFARRHKAAFATAALIAGSLVLGIIASTWQAARATRAEGLAHTRLEAETKERERAVQAESAAKQRLFDARLAEARAVRWSRQVGQRDQGWNDSLAVGDFNGDGRADVATANSFSDSVSVLLNDGNWPDPNIPAVSVSDVTVTEGNSGTGNATFTVTLSAAFDQTVAVNFATADGTATAGSDYQAVSGTLSFAPGETSKTVTVSVNGDRVGEPNETFVVNLSNPTNATIADGQGVGTILDDEPRISIGDVTKYEGKRGKTTLFTFTVTLSAAYDEAVTMSFQTVDGTATTSDKDYVAKSGTLTFNPGETTKTITIEVKGDSRREANETFYLDLFGNSSNSLFTKNRGLGTILNDD